MRHAGIDPGGGFKGQGRQPPSGGGGRGGGGGGKANSGGGGNKQGKANTLTPEQTEAKRIQDVANNKAWQLSQHRLKQQQWSLGGGEPPGYVQPYQQQYVQQWDETKTPRSSGKQRKNNAKKWWESYSAGRRQSVCTSTECSWPTSPGQWPMDGSSHSAPATGCHGGQPRCTGECFT